MMLPQQKNLKNISYFRLQGYWWEFRVDKDIHKFKPNSIFESGSKQIKLITI